MNIDIPYGRRTQTLHVADGRLRACLAPAHPAPGGLSQEELAQRVGVRRETIGNLEKGRYNPSLVLAWNIAKVFGVPIEEVFTVESDEN